MRWPWRPRETDEDRRARYAKHDAALVVREEKRRLEETKVLADRMANHRERNRFAEAMRIALGGRP